MGLSGARFWAPFWRILGSLWGALGRHFGRKGGPERHPKNDAKNGSARNFGRDPVRPYKPSFLEPRGLQGSLDYHHSSSPGASRDRWIVDCKTKVPATPHRASGTVADLCWHFLDISGPLVKNQVEGPKKQDFNENRSCSPFDSVQDAPSIKFWDLILMISWTSPI